MNNRQRCARQWMKPRISLLQPPHPRLPTIASLHLPAPQASRPPHLAHRTFNCRTARNHGVPVLADPRHLYLATRRVVLAVKDYHARRGRGWARPPYKGVRPHALFSGFGTVPVPSPRLWTNRKNPAARSAVVQRDPLKLYEISAVPLAREPTHNSTYTRLRCSPMSAPRALGQQ